MKNSLSSLDMIDCTNDENGGIVDGMVEVLDTDKGVKIWIWDVLSVFLNCDVPWLEVFVLWWLYSSCDIVGVHGLPDSGQESYSASNSSTVGNFGNEDKLHECNSFDVAADAASHGFEGVYPSIYASENGFSLIDLLNSL